MPLQVPTHVRRLLAAESAANVSQPISSSYFIAYHHFLQDGLAYPFLWLPLYLTLDKTTGEAINHFITIAFLYQVMLGIGVGLVLGFSFSAVMKYLESKRYIGRDSYVIQFVSLATFTIGVVTLMGSDDLLAAFAAGK